MLKKLTAVLLTVTMLFAALGVSAFAIDFRLFKQSTVTENVRLKKTVEKAAAKLIGEKGEATVSDALLEAVTQKVGENATASSVNAAMNDFAVFEISDLPETARRIAENAEYKILKGNTVYIVIELDKYPELSDVITLCEASKALYEKQNEFIAESGKDGLKANTYIHIIGELALHYYVYSLTKAAGGANKKNPLYFLYESARLTELNQNEIRGAGLIEIVGAILSAYYNSKK